MSFVKSFDDGSSVEWIDRETLKYSRGEFSVLVWIDSEPGVFSTGRIIRMSSIRNWETSPEGCSDQIDDNVRKEIIDKILLYFKNRGCRIEP